MARFPRIIPLLSAIGAVALCASASLAGGRPRAEDEWSRRYTLAAGGTLAIENANGAIEALPAEGAEVEVVATRVAKARSLEAAQALLAKVELREEAAPERVHIAVVSPSHGETEVRFVVRVPTGVSVDLSTANGAVTLQGLDAPVRAETANGFVRAQALATDRVDARSVNGAVDVALAKPLAAAGAIALETVNGRVALALPAASHATIEATTVNGSVEAIGAALEVQRKSRTGLEATLNGGGGAVRLETVNGAAKLEVSAS